MGGVSWPVPFFRIPALYYTQHSANPGGKNGGSYQCNVALAATAAHDRDMDSELTGRTAGLMLRAALGHPMRTAMYEGFCAGNANLPVHGVAVCYAPTLEVLRRAGTERKTLIISREHPFFLHGGLNYSYGTDGLEAAMKDDPVVLAKRQAINTNQLMVHRAGGWWDEFRPKAQSEALARALGLTPAASGAGDRNRWVVCNVPRTALATLAQTAADRLKTRHPRTVGDAKAIVSRVAVLAGECDPPSALGALLADSTIDGLIVGGGGTVDEVDGATAYVQDVIGSGRRLAVLAVGYGPSHDPGVGQMAQFLRGVFPDLAVEWWPASDASWIPRS